MASKDLKESALVAMATRINSEVQTLITEFIPSSDRASVLIGAAILDDLVSQLVLRVLIPNATREDELFDQDRPLSTFSAKISIAYRLGLIDSQFARVLHLIRKIRNEFAHEISGCDLNKGPHQSRLAEIVRAFNDSSDFVAKRELLLPMKRSESWTNYIAAVLVLLSCLIRARETANVIANNPLAIT